MSVSQYTNTINQLMNLVIDNSNIDVLNSHFIVGEFSENHHLS